MPSRTRLFLRRPITMRTFNVQPTTLGGTVEKLEMGMTGIYSGCRPEACYRIEPDLRPNINETLGQAYTNVPIRAVTWRDTKTTLHNQMEGPHRGGRMDPRLEWTADKARPYTRYTVKTKGPHTLRTQNHTSSSYHGLMFAVRAGKAPIRITKLHTACGGRPRKELYRVYTQPCHFLDGVIDPSKWREVACGECELPTAPKVYGEIPWPHEGLKVQAGEVASIYIHSPYNQQGVCFRKFAKSWPGYPRMDYATDKDSHVGVLVARATYSQTPFERLSKDSCAFAGLLEYEVLDTEGVKDPSGMESPMLATANK